MTMMLQMSNVACAVRGSYGAGFEVGLTFCRTRSATSPFSNRTVISGGMMDVERSFVSSISSPRVRAPSRSVILHSPLGKRTQLRSWLVREKSKARGSAVTNLCGYARTSPKKIH